MARRFLALTFLAATAMQAATGVAPASAFIDAGYTPQVLASGYNVDFSVGFEAGESVAIVLPSNHAYPDWWTYIAAVRQSEMPRVRMVFFPINYNVGFDSAEEVAAHYFFYNDPTSCGVVDCSAFFANARIRHVKAPLVQKHLDLVGKGVKGVVKVTYRGARVIL